MNPKIVGQYRILYIVYPNGLVKVDAILYDFSGEPIHKSQWDSLGLDLSDKQTTPLPLTPDWEKFYNNFENSTIELTILQSPNKISSMKLSIEFGKRSTSQFNLNRLANYWNLCVLKVLFTQEQIEQLKQWVIDCNLPITLDSKGFINL